MPNSRSKKHKSSSKIILNVGGTRHQTYLSTLRNIPDTRLYNLCEHHSSTTKAAEFDSSRNEYFFDRHPGVFAHILNYYRTGKLHCPYDICGPLFEEELEFWGIDEQQVETCCWEVYKQHKEKQEKLKYFKLPGFDERLDSNACQMPKEYTDFDNSFSSWWARLQPRAWRLLEEPHSSQNAKVIAIISFVLFALYITKFSLSTLPIFSDTNSSYYLGLYIVHIICLSWFTVDLVLRVIFSPVKTSFFTSICTWIDIISLIPLYISHFATKADWVLNLELLVMFKAVRIFQLFKLSYVMQVLVNTLKASLRELCVLLVIMAFQTAVFSSILYFIEKDVKKTEFDSIPDTMWWAIITMTTVGYGDVSPQTWMGKIVGSACAIFGVLVIALPVSVVASNFSIFYTYAKARLNVPQKTRKVAIPHALKSISTPHTRSVGGHMSINNTSYSSERRNTQRTPNASELSFNYQSSLQGSLANSYKSHSNSQSLSMSASKSLNSLLPDYGYNSHHAHEEKRSRFPHHVRRANSELVLSASREDQSVQGPLLSLPLQNPNKENGKPNIIFSNISLNICPNYPLYVRRGAVTPASLSLKSNSSNSSHNNIFKNDHLNIGRPIIFLSGNSLSVQNLRSVQTLIPDITCSCTSLRSRNHVHSADDSIPLTPLLSNVDPIMESTPTLKKNSRCSINTEMMYTNGPFIAISSPSDEKIDRAGIATADKCTQTDWTSDNICRGNFLGPNIYKYNQDDQAADKHPNRLGGLVTNPLHDVAFPKKSKLCDVGRHMRRSTTL